MSMGGQMRYVDDGRGGQRALKVDRAGIPPAEEPPLLVAVGGLLSDHLDSDIAEWRCWVHFGGGEADCLIAGVEFLDVFRQRESYLRRTGVRYVDMIRAVVRDPETASGWREVALEPESVVHTNDLFASRLKMRLAEKRRRIEQECGYKVHWLDTLR